jgi:hypothetical protein
LAEGQKLVFHHAVKVDTQKVRENIVCDDAMEFLGCDFLTPKANAAV